MVQVNLPPGCRSLAMEDGTRYRAAREGGVVNVSHGHAVAINKMPGNGDAGLVTAHFRAFGGTKGGRTCACSLTIWNSWTKTCPKCGAATETE